MGRARLAVRLAELRHVESRSTVSRPAPRPVAPASSAVQLPLALVADQLSLFEPSPETLTGPAWRARLREALARGTWPALASGRRCVVVARL